jgi:hypothetical protein
MQEQAQQERSFETLVAFLIAIVTVTGALIAWRAAVADDGSGDADFAGLRAAINLEESRALTNVNAFEHYSAFTEYRRYDTLGTAMAEEASSGEVSEEFMRELTEVNDLTIAKQTNFPAKFLNRDGTYALQREIGEMNADAAKERDVNPEPQFAEADALREKTRQLLISIMVLGMSLVAYTLVETVSARAAQLAIIALGTLLGLAGAGYAVYIDMFAR